MNNLWKYAANILKKTRNSLTTLINKYYSTYIGLACSQINSLFMKGAGGAGDISCIKTQTEEIKPVSADDSYLHISFSVMEMDLWHRSCCPAVVFWGEQTPPETAMISDGHPRKTLFLYFSARDKVAFGTFSFGSASRLHVKPLSSTNKTNRAALSRRRLLCAEDAALLSA